MRRTRLPWRAAASLLFALGAGLAAVLPAALATAFPAELAAQQLTVERMFTSGEFFAEYFPDVTWSEDGSRMLYVESREGGVTDLVAEDAITGNRTVLINGDRLIAPGGTQPFPIEGFQISPDGRRALLVTNTQYVWRDRTRGIYFVFDLNSGAVRPLSPNAGWQQFAKFSPDGSRIGFVRNNDLWVRDLEARTEWRLTDDGSPTVFNGTFDWVYEEELGLQDGWRWSPDGSRIAYWRLDDGPVPTFVYDMEYSELYPETVSVPYPKAGDANPLARIGVVGADGGETRWIDVGNDPDVYLARMEWAESDDELVIQRLNRLQNRLDVLLADVETGATRLLMTDSSETWVDVDDHFHWVSEGERFIWSSQQDGFLHLYLHDRSGSRIRQLTRGRWDVATPVAVVEPGGAGSVAGAAEGGGWVYFTAHRESPLQTNLYRVALEGGEIERVTPADGSHEVSVNARGTYFVDIHTRAGVPPTTVLRRGDGSTVRTLVSNGALAERLDDMGLNRPEFFTFENGAGVELNGWMIRPPGFDPSREYPVFMWVYGGPGSQRVVDDWFGLTYIWHQLLAERGYIVVSVDGRGTGARGRDFTHQVYQRLGQVEARDQIEAADWLAAQPYVDGDRIAIYGSSYGGYLTLLAMMWGEGRFKAGIAQAPVTDWRLYDTIYTERFMRTPDENPEGYREGAPLNHAADLEGSLLLIHGTGDDNVHFQNSVRLIEALQAEGKRFEFMLYPNQPHNFRGLAANLHVFDLMTEFVLEEL